MVAIYSTVDPTVQSTHHNMLEARSRMGFPDFGTKMDGELQHQAEEQ